MEAMERLWTVQDVMKVIPLGKTSCTKIINSLPNIRLGKKLMVEPRYIREWITRNTTTGKTSAEPAPVKKKPRARKIEGLTEDGLIPYRRTKKDRLTREVSRSSRGTGQRTLLL